MRRNGAWFGRGGSSTGYVSRKLEDFQARKSEKLSRRESGKFGKLVGLEMQIAHAS